MLLILMRTRILDTTQENLTKAIPKINLPPLRSILDLIKTVCKQITCPGRAAKHLIISILPNNNRNSRRKLRSIRKLLTTLKNQVMKMDQRNMKSCIQSRASRASWNQVPNEKLNYFTNNIEWTNHKDNQHFYN